MPSILRENPCLTWIRTCAYVLNLTEVSEFQRECRCVLYNSLNKRLFPDSCKELTILQAAFYIITKRLNFLFITKIDLISFRT